MNLTESQVAYINAQTAIFNCEVAGMMAENAACAVRGDSPSYDDGYFQAVKAEYELLIGHDALTEMGRDKKSETFNDDLEHFGHQITIPNIGYSIIKNGEKSIKGPESKGAIVRKVYLGAIQ
jgi:hypothetical protein